MADLFPPSNGHVGGNGKSLGRIVKTYNYHDESSKLVLPASWRHEPRNSVACAKRRRRLGLEATWHSSRTVSAARADRGRPGEIVFITEGEEDVLMLVAKGQLRPPARRRREWKEEYSAPMRVRRCVVLPDADEPGRDHAEQVQNRKAGAASVKVSMLPDLPAKEDVRDWLNNGGTIEALELAADRQDGRSDRPGQGGA